MRLPITRAMASAGPPAANGTTMVIGRVGKLCADAAVAGAINARAATISLSMVCSF
jgi:hypothetical protein